MSRIVNAVIYSVAAIACLGLLVALIPLALLDRSIMRALIGGNP